MFLLLLPVTMALPDIIGGGDRVVGRSVEAEADEGDGECERDDAAVIVVCGGFTVFTGGAVVVVAPAAVNPIPYPAAASTTPVRPLVPPPVPPPVV